MGRFRQLWKHHVGPNEYVCNSSTYPNQCAMRLGAALHDVGIGLEGKNLKRCGLDGHDPGHIRSAQQLANVFYRRPTILGPSVKKEIFRGSINDNIENLRRRKGVIFIMNGWGSTDHIDLWDGTKQDLRGADRNAPYRRVGEQVWFWELTS